MTGLKEEFSSRLASEGLRTLEDHLVVYLVRFCPALGLHLKPARAEELFYRVTQKLSFQLGL